MTLRFSPPSPPRQAAIDPSVALAVAQQEAGFAFAVALEVQACPTRIAI